MSRLVQSFGSMLATVGVVFLTGCTPSQPFYFNDDGNLSHYKDVATEIEYPDVDTCGLTEVDRTLPPLTVEQIEQLQPWDLTLEECVQISLANSKVVRQLRIGEGMNGTEAPDRLVRSAANGDSLPTVYNPAVQETDPAFGVEAALAAFDAQWTGDVTWQRLEQPQNSRTQLVAQEFFPRDLQQDVGTFNTAIVKRSAPGTQFGFRNQTNYLWNNIRTRDVPSDWNTLFQADVTQPLLRGAGVQFNRIAGPSSNLAFGFGNYRGVVIARINNDIALTDFESNVLNQVNDVEQAYRELYFLYRELDARKNGRDSALQTWRKVQAKRLVGAEGGGALDEARTRQQYYQFRAQVERVLWDLFALESRLRYLMGLAPTDGRLIRPIDEPTTALVKFDWCEIHTEALARQVNLRTQKWRIKRREMELIAARNFLLPQLDGIARYRWRGLGDDLFGNSDGVVTGSPFQPLEGTNAMATLFSGRYTEWDLGLQFSMNLGFRRELAAVRNAQLLLARERALLQDQELEVVHLLSDSVRNLERDYALMQTNFNRRLAALDEVSAAQVIVDVGGVQESGRPVDALDQLLEAQRNLAQAESDYYRSLVNYNKSILSVHYRKGSLLEYNNVYLAEGPWPCKAYFDARKRARERDAGLYIDYGFTRPGVVSRGEHPQFSGQPGVDGYGESAETAPGEASPTPAIEQDPDEPLDEASMPIENLPEPIPDPMTRQDNPVQGRTLAAEATTEMAPARLSPRQRSNAQLIVGDRPDAGAEMSFVGRATHARIGPAPRPTAAGGDANWKAVEP
jgi:outer membrane protein TolC